MDASAHRFSDWFFVAFAVLFASYHFLVRSTFIGRVLNGRSYPFVAWLCRLNDTSISTANAAASHFGIRTP